MKRRQQGSENGRGAANRGRGDEEEEEEVNGKDDDAGCRRDENTHRRPQKWRKLHQQEEHLPSSSDILSIKVSPPFDECFSVFDHLQDVSRGTHARFQDTKKSFPPTETYNEFTGTPPSDGSCHSPDYPQLQNTQSVKHTDAKASLCEDLSGTDAQIRSLIDLSSTHIPSPQSESGLSSKHTQISVDLPSTRIPNPQCVNLSSTHTLNLLGESGLSSEHTQISVFSSSQGACYAQNSPSFHAHHLPHDLIISNIVASRLPLINIIRARTVCRAWRDAIFSSAITKSFNANPDCRRPRLLVEHSSPLGPGLAVFDPTVSEWSVVPVPSFGRLVAASSGLFCYVTEAGCPPSLVVGNPLTNQWKHLPGIPLSMPAHGPQVVGMVANSSKGSFKVMVLFGIWDDDASDAYLPLVYDSITERWTRNSTVSARLLFASSRCVMKAPDVLLSVDSCAGNLMSYDMTECKGHTMQLQRLPLFINEEDQKTNLWRRLPQLAVCEGELFLVARCVGERPPECKLGHFPIVQHSSVGVWMMQTKSADWQFITRVPLDLLEKVVEGSDGTDFIIASNSGSTLFFVLKGSPHMLAYDTTSDAWSVLPGCPADYNSYPLHQSAFYEPLLWISAI